MSFLTSLFNGDLSSRLQVLKVTSSQLLLQKKYNVKPEQLAEIMKVRDKEGLEKLEDMGGIGGLCRLLKIDLSKGLDCPTDIQNRQRVFGVNKLPKATSTSFFSLVLSALKEPTMIMLEFCALVSFALTFYKSKHPTEIDDLGVDPESNQEDETKYGYLEALAILFSIVITVLVTACSEYSKESKFRDLQDQLEKETKINVLRNNGIHEISTDELVVGDICIIKYGDVIPADGVLFECNELKIDESSMTGESDLVPKDPKKDVSLFAGTHVMEGSGRMIVVAVGTYSQTGVIYGLMRSSQKEQSVIQAKLADLAVKIGYFGIGTAVITTVMLWLQSAFIHFVINRERFTYQHVQEGFEHIITGITILVVAVPEGLPLAVTLSLAYSVTQMMKDNNLVRHIDACETMGNATTICSDKTGTLTANRMTAVQCYTCGILYTSLSKRVLTLPEKVARIMAENIALNSANTSRIVKGENNITKQYGNKTECALLGLLFKLRYDYTKLRAEIPENSYYRVFSFNSTRKLMRTIIKLPNDQGLRCLAKGASEIILKKCTFIMGQNGTLLGLTKEEKDKIVTKVLKPMAYNGLRNICLAYLDYVYVDDDDDDDNGGLGTSKTNNLPPNVRPMKRNEIIDWEAEECYTHMTFLAVVGIEDPVRKDVATSIKKCQKAGITVRMVTGDNIDTARSIAIKCGIIKPSSDPGDEGKILMDSKKFNQIIRDEKGNISQEKFDKVWPKLRVLARSSPSDKYVLVKHIIASKINPVREVVAVTGDGTNDAPALKIADVGFAMGISGTEVAKEASDIILTDDNFSSIVKSVIWGRNVYDSIAKFIQFQVTVNIVAVLICFISACVIQESPLGPVQMLWVNLIMDTLGSLALSTEKPSKTLLLRKPYGRNKSLISAKMLKIILLNAMYQLTILIVFLFWGPELFGIDSAIHQERGVPTVHFTMLFNIFVMMTLSNEICSRKINGERNVFQGITTNLVFCTIFLVTFVLQVIIIQYGGVWFTTQPLTLSQWLWSITFGISMMLWSQVVITITERHNRYHWVHGVHGMMAPIMDTPTFQEGMSLRR